MAGLSGVMNKLLGMYYRSVVGYLRMAWLFCSLCGSMNTLGYRRMIALFCVSRPFRQRLDAMKQVYLTVCHLESLSSSAAHVPGSDPFYGRYPWFRLIGR